MESEYILKDNEQIKRMKEHALLSHFGCSGEIYKLLSLEVLHNLVKKIKKNPPCTHPPPPPYKKKS